MSGSRNGTSLGDVPLYHVVALLVTFAAAWGSLAGSPSAGIRRSPVRASAPVAHSLPGESAAGTARLDASSSEAPRVGAGTGTPDVVDCLNTSGVQAVLPHSIPGQGGPQLTATAGEDNPERPAAAVYQPGGAS